MAYKYYLSLRQGEFIDGMVVFNCTIDIPKLMEIILMAVHMRPKRDMQD